MPYAERTTVSTSKSRDEIERILTRFGASGQAFARDDDKRVVMVAFHRDRRNYRFTLPLPDAALEKFWYANPEQPAYKRRKRSQGVHDEAVEQETRRLFRSLANFIKATLDAVESGIITADEALLPYLILPSGSTVYETSVMQLADMGDVNFRKALGAGE